MPADSPLRRVAKRILFPLLPESLYAAIQGPVMARDITRGTWNEPETELVPLALRRGETAIDIGANFGMFTWHLSRAAGPSGRVYSFEPVPFTVKVFRSVARRLRLSNVDFRPAGCSDKAGTIRFTVPLQAHGGSSAGLAHMSGRNDDHPGKETQVRWSATKETIGEVVALDETLPELPRLSLIKADIEGAEPRAFQGARRLLEATRPTVICEINDWYLRGFGFTVQDLVGPFDRLGYQLYHYVNQPERRLRRVSPAEIIEDNYVFIHPSRLDRFNELL